MENKKTTEKEQTEYEKLLERLNDIEKNILDGLVKVGNQLLSRQEQLIGQVNIKFELLLQSYDALLKSIRSLLREKEGDEIGNGSAPP